MKKLLITLIAGLTVAATSQVVLASPANAVSCTWEGCNGRDPTSSGCSAGAYPLESFWSGNVFVELRYSPACRAVWARGVSHNQNRNCTGWTTQDVLAVEGSGNRSSVALRYVACLSYSPGYQFYTGMVGFHYWTRACYMYYPAMSSSLRYAGCTAWR